MIGPVNSNDRAGNMNICMHVSAEGDENSLRMPTNGSTVTLPSPSYKELSLMHQPPCSVPCWLMWPEPGYQQVAGGQWNQGYSWAGSPTLAMLHLARAPEVSIPPQHLILWLSRAILERGITMPLTPYYTKMSNPPRVVRFRCKLISHRLHDLSLL